MRAIICADCPDIIPAEDIVAYLEDDSEVRRPLIDLFSGSEGLIPPSAKRTGPVRRLLSPRVVQTPVADGDSSRDLLHRNKEKLKGWRFQCPKGHSVDGNPGEQFVLSVIGAAGSSKSHVLPGLLWETDALERLEPLGIALRKGLYSDIGLEAGQRDVFQHNMVLPATNPEAVLGPYGYRLSIPGTRGTQPYEMSLLLFDVGGEAVSDARRIGEVAKFVLLSNSILYLLDPDGLFPTKFDPDGQEPSGNARTAAMRQRVDAVDQMADALSSIWGSEMRQVPLVLAIAKSDSLVWNFSWDLETEQVIDEAKSHGIQAALTSSSDRVREALRSLGGDRIVNEVERRFPQDRVRYAAVSATSQMPSVVDGQDIHEAMPDEKVWDEPSPNGISLALLHALECAGVIPPESPR